MQRRKEAASRCSEDSSGFGVATPGSGSQRAAVPLYLVFPCRPNGKVLSPSSRQAYPIRDILQLRWLDGAFAHSFLLNDSEEALIPEE